MAFLRLCATLAVLLFGASLVPAQTSLPRPGVTVSGLVDGASFRPAVSAGGIASLFGTDLAGEATGTRSLPLPTTLGGATLTVGGIASPLFYVSPTQINFQIPWELSGESQVSLTLSTPGGVSNAQTASLSSLSPGIFTFDSSGGGQGIVTASSTGLLTLPVTPARRGDYITIYCSGLGKVSNQPATGAAAAFNPLSRTPLVPAVTIGGVQSLVTFSGLAPGFVGLYQVNALVPLTVSPGPAVPLALEINGVTATTVTIAVQ